MDPSRGSRPIAHGAVRRADAGCCERFVGSEIACGAGDTDGCPQDRGQEPNWPATARRGPEQGSTGRSIDQRAGTSSSARRGRYRAGLQREHRAASHIPTKKQCNGIDRRARRREPTASFFLRALQSVQQV